MTDTAVRLRSALSGRYRVERELGAGGMATVYLAQDERHDRAVAIKVLHPDLAASLGGERFLAEIKTTAKLQHPHILPLLDSGDADGLLFYVMPYVEGESLRGRLQRERQLPIDDAVRITCEVADALAYAHAQGIVHRDIKPENILLHSGHAMVADFGIALAVSAAGTSRMTQTGLSLGTPQYMSPEQAMGEKSIDQRTDVYALGAVAYEMLVGEPPFTGATVQAIVARLLTETPRPLIPQRRNVSPHVESGVLTALEKLPADRFGTASEFAAVLRGESGATRARTAARAPGAQAANPWRTAALGLGALAAASLAFAAWDVRGSAPPPSGQVRFSFPLPSRTTSNGRRVAIARDGAMFAYLDESGGNAAGIYVRSLNRSEASRVAGTEGAVEIAFSPDGKSIAFQTSDGALKTVALDGSTPTVVARKSPGNSGLAWSEDGFLYFSSADSGRVARMPALGGSVEQLGTLDSSTRAMGYRLHRTPRPIGTTAVLFSVYRGPGMTGDIGVVDIKARTTRFIAKGDEVLGIYNGFLYIVSADGAVQANRFDERTLTTIGAPVTVMQNIAYSGLGGSAHVAVAENGTVIYMPGNSGGSQLVWVDLAGRETPVNAELTKGFTDVQISPAGDRIALSFSETDGTGGTWMYDIGQRTLTPITQGGALSMRPYWSPDGSSIVFTSDRGRTDGVRSLWLQRLGGGDSAIQLIPSRRHAQEVSWVKGSNWIVYREGYDDTETFRDLRYRAVGADTTTRVYLNTKADEKNPALSPDGRWLAYASDESGRDEVYIDAFPGRGARVPVSTDGGVGPVWAHSGRTLYFRSLTGEFTAVDVAGGARVTLTGRRTLFNTNMYLEDASHAPYDIAPDDKRFLFIKPSKAPVANVIVGWFDEIAPKLAARK